MMSPESYPTLFPFSSPSVWHTSTGLPLSYGPMVLSQARYLYPLSASSSRRRHPRCSDEKRTSSFTIDAILGLREAEVNNSKEKHNLEDAVNEVSSHETRFDGVEKMPNRRHATVFSPKLPAGHIAFVPGCLSPQSGGDDQTARRPILKGEIVKESTFIKGTNEEFKFLGSYGTAESCRQGLGRHDSGLKRSTRLDWNDDGIHEQTKPKRVRTIFTQDQLDRLENEFSRQQYMVGTERLYLASQLDLSESQVKVWFQNRRIKWRKQNLEQQQHKLAKYRALRDTERKDIQSVDDRKVNERFDEGDVLADVNIAEGNVCQDKERKTITKGNQSSGKEGSFDPDTERTSSPNYLLQTHELKV